MIFAYLGPDTYLPLTSVVAAATGAILMFGRNAARLMIGSLRAAVRRPRKAGSASARNLRRDSAQGLDTMLAQRAGRTPSHVRAAVSELTHQRGRPGH